MTKQQKIIGIIIGIVAVIGAVTAVLALTWQRWQAPNESATVRDTNSQQASPQQNTTQPPAQTSQPAPQPGAARTVGYYGDYTDARAADRSYDKTILFFHAPWCNECRAFEQAIQAGPIPADVQILKVDYDSRQDLRQKYGVRIQSTFVELDDDDDQDNDHDVWVGYGKDKSVDTILRNL
ncbi:MAG: thioredoxin family protein [Candidatus Saccharibacteria bacterium]|nr:thioredoxin family protein [Candidatus Saccharibacteria bacterium]